MINEAAINYLIQGWSIKTELKTQPSTALPEIFVLMNKKKKHKMYKWYIVQNLTIWIIGIFF